jgi:chromosome segregation ATPase
LEVTFAGREKETALKAFETLQKQHDALALQQSSWDTIAAATEKIDMVYKLLENVDDEDQKELRHHRDHSQALENENMALQKRSKELEAKVANSDKAATTMRQSLTQAQHRSTEWERRAKEYEGRLEMAQTTLDQVEQTKTQLETDLSMFKLQIEEQEADRRLSQVGF